MLPRFLLLTGPAFAGLLPLLTAKRRVGVASALICTPRWDKADRWGAESFFLLPSACEYATYYVAWKTKPQSKKTNKIPETKRVKSAWENQEKGFSSLQWKSWNLTHNRNEQRICRYYRLKFPDYKYFPQRYDFLLVNSLQYDYL